MTLYVPHRYRFKWSAVADLTVVPTSYVDHLARIFMIAEKSPHRKRVDRARRNPPQPIRPKAQSNGLPSGKKNGSS